jgi:hypothetical protein
MSVLQSRSTDIYTDYVRDWKEKGGRVLGYACVATPVEIVEAAGILPYRIKAFGHPDTELGDSYLARFNCRFCRSCLQLGLDGTYDFLDGLVETNGCDHLRGMFENWQYVKKYGFFHYLKVPHFVREDSLEYFTEELGLFRLALEEHFEVEITDNALREAMGTMEQVYARLRDLYALRERERPVVSGAEAMRVVCTGSSMRAADFLGLLDRLVEEKLKEMESHLTKVMKDQLATGLITMHLSLRNYVGRLTGLAREMDALSEGAGARGTDEVLAQHRRMRELEKKLDEHIEHATERLDTLKTSVDLNTHLAVVLGFFDLLEPAPVNDAEALKLRQDHEREVASLASRVKDDPKILEVLDRIRVLREEVALKMGLESEMDEVRTLSYRIKKLLDSRGFRTGKENYIQTLAQGLALFAMAFYGKDIVYRTTDFKSNEYRKLLGGDIYEPEEENPMLGFRGASRYIAHSFRDCFELECRAMKKVRNELGLTNVELMVPFVRNLEEGRGVVELLAEKGLRQGENGLRLIMMCEIPSNALLAEQFLQIFDGFSIGSNDLTQLTLGLDRDSGLVAHAFDERDPAVKQLLSMAIATANRMGKYVGICGQGPSDHADFAEWLMNQGIQSISLNPDTVVDTWMRLAKRG